MSIHDLLSSGQGADGSRAFALSPEAKVFVTERHLATLTTRRADGTPHVVPVAFTWCAERGVARVTTNRTSVKVKNALRMEGEPGGTRAALCQVDGGRWLTLEGNLRVVTGPDAIAAAVRDYAKRYRVLSENPQRIVLELTVDHVMGSGYMVGR